MYCAPTFHVILCFISNIAKSLDEHLISLQNLDKLLYKQSGTAYGGVEIEKPKFFVSQEDTSNKTEFFPQGSEAERRITFFGQSLSMNIPPSMSVSKMVCIPTLTILMNN